MYRNKNATSEIISPHCVKKWYFVTKIPTVRKNCSSDREKLLKFEAEGKIFEITGTIYRNNERSEQYIRSNKQLELGLIRIIQIGKHNWDLGTCKKNQKNEYIPKSPLNYFFSFSKYLNICDYFLKIFLGKCIFKVLIWKLSILSWFSLLFYSWKLPCNKQELLCTIFQIVICENLHSALHFVSMKVLLWCRWRKKSPLSWRAKI